MSRRFRWLLAGLLACIPATAMAASGLAVAGQDGARILIPQGAQVTAYENAGYRLTVEDDEARVQVHLGLVGSREPFELAQEAAGPAVLGRLARGLTADAETRYQAVSRILTWVARHIEYNLDRSQPQEALEVLERRTAYCTGIARLTVALLRAVGIPAREVAGYVAADGSAEVAGYHRWVETDMGGGAWVFSDPLHTHHYVPANYLRLASEVLLDSAPNAGLTIERNDRVKAVDLAPLAAVGVRVRRNTPRRHAAALQVVVEDPVSGLAVLEGEGRRLSRSLEGGTTTFVGLEPGSYHLEVHLPGRSQEMARQVELLDRIYRTVHLGSPPLPRGGNER